MNSGIVLVDVAVKDLSGAALDWAIAQVKGARVQIVDSSRVHHVDSHGHVEGRYQPSNNWGQGGPLAGEYRVTLIYNLEQYDALIGMTVSEQHAEPLVAACRAIVAAKLGDIVKVPACLVMP